MSFSFKDWISSDLAIDLGTANTLGFCSKQSIVTNEPFSGGRTKSESGNCCLRNEAKEMLGRTPVKLSPSGP